MSEGTPIPDYQSTHQKPSSLIPGNALMAFIPAEYHTGNALMAFIPLIWRIRR
ncbi:MAG: hypothetical protein OXD54_03320 [Candidatus Poribacteria bacterium]|nr:hypothetical protein [Candidatus Poribacteria bacterium]